VDTSRVASHQPLAVAGSEQAATRAEGPNALRKIAGLLESAVLLLLVVLLFPLVILVVGAPIALFVRAVLEIVKRF